MCVRARARVCVCVCVRARARTRVCVCVCVFSCRQIRTLLWHQFYVLCPGAEKWQRSCARTRLMHALDQLKKMLTGRMRVDHFFVPGMDIMAEVPQHEREFLYIMFTIAEKLF